MYATKEHLREALRTAYLKDVPVAISDSVFRKAWEDGHGNGEHEVEMVYEEIAEIVMQTREAYR